ncbi:MAG: site-specific DNA-methyltransferase [Planctomycetes bacterium]|nr:site-specific DNA-methyltransferase [Planctomycetota bacterium]
MASKPELFEQLVGTLGLPYSRGDSYALYCADCLDLAQSMPREVLDLTVTSPPYNIGKEYETPLSIDRYVEWCQRWMNEIHRLTYQAGAFWLNLGYVSLPGTAKALPLPYLLWSKCPFFLIQEVVWNYGAGMAGKKYLSPRNEKFLWYVKDPEQYTFNLDAIRDPDVKYPQQKKNGKLRCNTIGKNPSDVWQIAKVTSGEMRSSPERAPHPAQFPLDLIQRLVLGFSNLGEIVFDPFSGSGTTGESCIQHERFFIGAEIDEDYCRYAAGRLKRASHARKSLLFKM